MDILDNDGPIRPDDEGSQSRHEALDAAGIELKERDMGQIAAWIAAVVAAPGDTSLHAQVAGEVRELCAAFPAPGILN